ncbi:MAG TPA: N-acetyltransferase [Aggregatilineales bacterium]|nr:GNAT family N-acetyltransferase [Anaerolineales bacterium]HRE47316.1 N-acetyltransferase [Aggregatilineales bacterium]
MAASIVGEGRESSEFTGMRHVNLRRDLGAVAELIELCFGATMDEAGRAAVREMRMISQSGPLLWLLAGVDRMAGGLEQGFVYLDRGVLVGNVSVSKAALPRSMGKGHIVANVATHPDYRRQGIAETLMKASLELIGKLKGHYAILQVDAENGAARRLYERLGFSVKRTFIRWQRPNRFRPPLKLMEMPDITLRGRGDWQAEYAIAERVRPNERGGMGWLQPTLPEVFRPSLGNVLGRYLAGKGEEHWIIREPTGRGVAASLSCLTSFGGAAKLTLIVHPSYQGQYEAPLVNYALRRLEGYRAPINIEHPADDVVTTALLDDLGFERRQTWLQMRWEMPVQEGRYDDHR